MHMKNSTSKIHVNAPFVNAIVTDKYGVVHQLRPVQIPVLVILA